MRTVIHGDCKVNNLLFHRTEPRVTHLIDLDTAMYGHPAWDFGDLVRLRGQRVGGRPERAPRISVETFKRVARGFARGAGGIADPRGLRRRPRPHELHARRALPGRSLFGRPGTSASPARGQNLERARSQLAAARRFDALKADFEDVLRHVAVTPVV